VKRQFRLGAVLTETAAEGFLLASVQSDDTPLFVTLNSVAMTRPMHRHIARGPPKKSAVLENTARFLIVGYWPSDLMAVTATPFTILTSMAGHTTGMGRGRFWHVAAMPGTPAIRPAGEDELPAPAA